VNLYRQLKELLPTPALMVGTVAINHGDGTVTVTHPDGNAQRVRGDVTVGQQVFFRDGVVEGDAPNLPLVSIDV
jgi:hypothetical protein